MHGCIFCNYMGDEMRFRKGYLQRYWSGNDKDNNRLCCPHVSEAREYN
jgi:hypothetical protein